MIPYGPRVLLVDYEPDLRDLEELILREASYQVVVASPNTNLAWQVERARPDVVVFGIRPHEPADWTSIDWMRSHPLLRAVPVVVISTAESVVAGAHAAPNVRATVVAPYDVGTFQGAVATALGDPPSAALFPPSAGSVPSGVDVAADGLLQGARVIVLRTVERLRRSEPYASRFSDLSVALIDDLPSIFGVVVNGVQRDLSPAAVLALPAVSQVISRHIGTRSKQGVGVAVAIREYQALRDEMVAYLNGQDVGEGVSALDIVEICRRIDRFIEQVAQVVVEQFGDPEPLGRPGILG